MKSGTIAGIVVALLLAVGGVAFIASRDSTEVSDSTATKQESSTTAANETSAPAPETEAQKNSQLLKAFEVAEHAVAEDCWTIVNGIVYDITEYVPRHPGGNEILRACGVDGTSLFDSRTSSGGEKVGSGTAHSAGASNQLGGFKIGTLDATAE